MGDDWQHEHMWPGSLWYGAGQCVWQNLG